MYIYHIFIYFQKESSTAGDLKTLLIALKFPKPPANITPRILFEKVETKVSIMIKMSCEIYSN